MALSVPSPRSGELGDRFPLKHSAYDFDANRQHSRLAASPFTKS